MFAEWTAAPRGSNSSILRRPSSWSRRWTILSNMVLPGTSTTPPVMTLPYSPSAWTPTTVKARFQRIRILPGDQFHRTRCSGAARRSIARGHRARLAVLVDRDVGELALCHQNLGAVAARGPGLDPDGDRGAPDPLDLAVAGEQIADEDRQLEGH